MITENNDTSAQNVDNQPNAGNEQPTVNAGAIRKSTTGSILKAASNALGQEIESVEGLVAAIARLSSNSVVTKEPSIEEPKSRRSSTNDLQEQFVQLKNELHKKDQALKERELDSEIRMNMGDKFDSDLLDYALTKVRNNIKWENDGSYSIVNGKGQIRYGDDGNPLTIKGLVDEVARSNPKLLRSSMNSTGSGLRQSGSPMFGGDADSIPDYSTNPDQFNAWAARNGLGKNVGLKGVKASVYNSSTSKKVF
jgi:hypothetical protein